jgi:hypothetical protein
MMSAVGFFGTKGCIHCINIGKSTKKLCLECQQKLITCKPLPNVIERRREGKLYLLQNNPRPPHILLEMFRQHLRNHLSKLAAYQCDEILVPEKSDVIDNPLNLP